MGVIPKRMRDYAEVRADGRVSVEVTRAALTMLSVDKGGFDDMDRRLLLTIIEKFAGQRIIASSVAGRSRPGKR